MKNLWRVARVFVQQYRSMRQTPMRWHECVVMAGKIAWYGTFGKPEPPVLDEDFFSYWP